MGVFVTFMAKRLQLLLLAMAVLDVWADPARTGPNLGKPASGKEAAAWSIGVFPDGTGLPPGRGNAVGGETVYNRHCVSCHGPGGIGATAEELAGGRNGLIHEYPDKTIGTYWPYATTVFDFTRRAMPLNAPGSLSDDEVYAVTAYLLYLNSIIDKTTEINAITLPKVKMPNRNGFIQEYRVD